MSHRKKVPAFSSTRVELLSPEISFWTASEHMLFQVEYALVAVPGRELSQGLLMGKSTALTCLKHWSKSTKGRESATPALLLPREMIKRRARPSPTARDAQHSLDSSRHRLLSLPQLNGKPIKHCKQWSLCCSSLEAFARST